MSADVGVVPAASAVFSAHASQYTSLRRRLVPGFDEFYAAAVTCVGLAQDGGVTRVLDLGAGTGLLSGAVAEAYPDAEFVLLDGSAEMLAEARERLGDAVEAVHTGDMAAGLPEGQFDAVISALAIHHLEDPGKRDLFARINAGLRPGGVFVNAEQVAGPTPELTDIYNARWTADCVSLGASESEIEAAIGRMTHDRCADVESQLSWLREAGFSSVDCAYKRWRFAVMVASKGPAT